MALVALPGIKMWALKTKRGPGVQKDGWTQWCSRCQRWPTEGKLQDKCTLLRTRTLSLYLPLSLSLTHTHAHKMKTITNLAAVVASAFCWFGFWVVAKQTDSQLWHSDRRKDGEDMRAVSKSQSYIRAWPLFLVADHHRIYFLFVGLFEGSYVYFRSVIDHHSIYIGQHKQHLAPMELSSLWSYSLFLANSRISCVKFEFFSSSCSCDPSVYHSSAVLMQVNFV